MGTRNQADHLKIAASLKAQSLTGTANGTGIDTQGFSSITMVLDAGATGGTTPSFTMQMQESDDNSVFTAIAAGDIGGGGQLAAITGANDDTVYKRAYLGSKRYVRWAATAVSGTSPTFLASASVILGKGHAPVS